MSRAISLFIALPIGSCVGCCLVPCATKAYEESLLERRCCSVRKLLFPSLMVIGVLGLYVPLFILLLCAKYDGVSVSTSLKGGECWSTGGDMSYIGLGVAAGIITGIGVTGCMWLLFAIWRAAKDESLQVVDVEDGTRGMV